MNPPTFPLAMQPPQGELNYITEEMLQEAIELSRKSPRKRIILPFHKSAEDTLHRMINVIQPGSYIRPHSHESQGKAESIVLLRGGICYLTFDKAGNLLSHHDLRAGTAFFGVDTEPTVIHSFFALEPDTVIFEVKPGPYQKITDKGFAEWSPEEGTEAVDAFLQKMMELTGHL